MSEYVWFNSKQIPVIRIVKGSSKFYANLIRSYLRNHEVVQIFSTDTRVTLAIWLIYDMSKEIYIDNIFVSWVDETPTLSFLVHSQIDPCPVNEINLKDGDFYIKYSKNTDLKTIQRLLNDKPHASIICAGSPCYHLLSIIPYLYTIGFIYYNIGVVKTYDAATGMEKAGIKVSVIPFNDEMLDMQPHFLQETTMQEVL